MKHLAFLLIGIAAVWGAVVAINQAQTGLEIEAKLKTFKHPAIQMHWTNPVERTVTVLLDRWAVTGTDTACEYTLDMLDRITEIAPGWEVHLISPTGWVPAKINPLTRQDVVAMVHDQGYWDRGRPGADVNE